eukprot:GEMP01111154.1.p1 GENE.GEMP01111154.1~~GEMP01111154.1.p1  ORF type:complete len:129 (+),score=20.89 GEMP01111154.1:178-564(+)
MGCNTPPEYNIYSEEHMELLKSDKEWHAGYLEGVCLCARAWGWDVAEKRRVEDPDPSMKWRNWDVRLAKMIRSLWLFGEKEYFDSMQAYANSLLQNEKQRQRTFQYGNICLDELLYLELPRERKIHSV